MLVLFCEWQRADLDLFLLARALRTLPVSKATPLVSLSIDTTITDVTDASTTPAAAYNLACTHACLTGELSSPGRTMKCSWRRERLAVVKTM